MWVSLELSFTARSNLPDEEERAAQAERTECTEAQSHV